MVLSCGLKGREANPIFVLQFPGERTTADGGIEADWFWLWASEIANPAPSANVT